MDNLLSVYRQRLDLQNADFSRIDHHDTMIAVVYRVTQTGRPPLILKISAQEIHFLREVYFLERFTDTLPIPRIVKVVEPEADLHGAILMECLAGTLLQETDWTDALAYEVGSTLARIHLNSTEGYGDLTRPQDLTPDPRVYFGKKFEEELTECVPHLPPTLIDQVHLYFRDHLSLLESVDGPCVVHRDYRPGNMMVDKGKLQGIIDWAGGRSGFAEQDFVPMAHWKWPSQQRHRKSLLAGYASIRPVPDYHVIMTLLQLGRALAVIGYTVKTGTWNSDNASIYLFNRQFLETFPFQSPT